MFCFNYDKSSNKNLTVTNGKVYTLNVKMQDGVLTVWADGYDAVLTVKAADTYKPGAISLMARKFGGDSGGFKSCEVRNLDADGYIDLDNADVSALTEKGFTSTRFSKAADGTYQPVEGETDQAVSAHWFSGTGDGTPYNGVTGITGKNIGLKPNANSDSNRYYLNTPYTYENFKVTAQVYWGVLTGVAFGGENAYPADTDASSVVVYFNNNKIQVNGALDFTSASVTGANAAWNPYDGKTGIFNFDSTHKAEAGKAYTLNVEFQDGVLTVWVDGYDGVLTINVLPNYQSGRISLLARKLGGDSGGLKSLEVRELETAIQKEAARKAQEGDSFDNDFTASDFKVSDLDPDFSAYYFETTGAEATRWLPSVLWTGAKKGSNSTPWLKPVHASDGKKYSLLTYDRLIFQNADITAKYLSNYTQYGVMIAPEGEYYTVKSGVKVWAESTGIIKIAGAIDVATGTAAGGFVRINGGSNALTGFAIDGYKAPGTEYTLRVKVQGSVLSVWMEEFPEYVISVNLTEDYQGGMVSLYSSGYQTGGLGSFSAKELAAPAVGTTENTYTQSFNTISSLEELADFTAYTLDSAENTPAKAAIEDVFALSAGRLIATGAEVGKNDRTNFSILTLDTKAYKNFELTMTYEQSRMQRYGVMFGLEPGEFAYTQNGSRLIGNGGAYVYTEAEGYRNVRGSMYASFYTSATEALRRERGETLLDSFYFNGSLDTAVSNKVLHTMTIRVVGDYMTVVIDNNEDSRVTVRLADYQGGYISLVSDASAATTRGAFCSLSVTELGEDASLETDGPAVSDGFETLEQVDEMFDAYYLTNAKETSAMEAVDIRDHWWLNTGGFLSRMKSSTGYSVTEDVEVLTYTKQEYTDFEMTYTYQQNWLRLGVLIGGELGEYPLSYVDGKLTADRGAVIFLEAEGYSNLQGQLAHMTSQSSLLYRVTSPAPSGFKDESGSVTANIAAKKEHTVKIVVKDKELYIFLDGSQEPSCYANLGEQYNGGYVSLFAHASSGVGFNNFTITDKVTTTLPKGGGASSSGNTYTADFGSAKFDDSAFTTYYLSNTKKNATGSMEQQNFSDQWTVANGVLCSNSSVEAPSSSNLTEFEYEDAAKVSVLTYNKKMTDFIVSYDYVKTPARIMFMFGTELGKYALAATNTTERGQGVLIYPENDLGAGGGIVALGSLATYNSSMRPLARKVVSLDGYHIAGQWASNVGTWHTMTVAVINSHCYIYLDDYGLIADYALVDYNGGYISLATTRRGVCYDNLVITDLSDIGTDSVIAAEDPGDLTVLVGTDASALSLPSTVPVTLKNGSRTEAPVKWTSLNYNGAEAGVYQFTAVVGETSGVTNPAQVGVRINVRVVEELPVTAKGVKYWSFDTEDDLKDFKAFYLKDAETGYLTEGTPNWYVSAAGQLKRDPFRAVNGTEYKDIGILTYMGETYINFELEVEYSQQWQRMMVMFGSEKAGAYIDLNDIYAESNPVAAFVEMEGTRNLLGNLINANFDTNSVEKINNARETGVHVENYYDKVLYGGNQGKTHTMKLRVVGDQAYLWVDDVEEPYVCTLTNYDGGYISLATTCKSGFFDNLKITRLNAQGEPVAEDPAIAANGTCIVTVDTDASTDLVIPTREKPESFETEKETIDPAEEGKNGGIPAFAYAAGGAMILAAALIGGVFLLLAFRRKRKKEAEA